MKPALLLASALAIFAQQPSFENARLETRAVSGALDPTMRAFLASQSAPAWIGYSVPIVAGDRRVCGWDGGHNNSKRMSLEGPTALAVLYRVEQNKVMKVRIATPDCEVDAGGASVTWLTGVNPGESVAFLSSLQSDDRLIDPVVSAIALHKDPAADGALEGFLAPDQPVKLREKAVMWLCIGRGRYDRVVQIAHSDKSAHIRGQALFWLAQGAQKKLAADTIVNAIENDPETEVKKKAVFALSQLPEGEGVAKLIQVARTNRNTEVRKQALFWLGQSKDPRALDFIEQILIR